MAAGLGVSIAITGVIFYNTEDYDKKNNENKVKKSSSKHSHL
jgi:hypothetical protein